MTIWAPLSGISVVEVSGGWAGPLCGKLLADLGADVCKIPIPAAKEYPGTRRQGEIAYALVNASKRCMPKSLTGQSRDGLIGAADVVLRDEWGIAAWRSYGVAERAAHAIWCDFYSVTKDRAFAKPLPDLVLQALSGVMSTTGERNRQPLRVGAELSGAVGALFGCIGVLAALFQRESSGLGQEIEVSLSDALTVSTTNFASRVFAGLPPLERLGNQGPNTAPWNLFPAADGESVYIAAGNDATFTRLCAAMERHDLARQPQFLTEELRRQNAEVLTHLVGEWTSTRSVGEITSILRQVGVPASEVRSLHQVLSPVGGESTAVRYIKDKSGRDWLTSECPLGAPSAGSPTVDFDASSQGEASLATEEYSDWCRQVSPTGARSEGPYSVAPALSGVTVVEVGIQTAGPYCCRILADLGADVVKVEPPRGEQGRRVPPMVNGASAYFDITNANKRGAVADLHSEAGTRLVKELFRTADAVVTNVSAASLSRRGIELEAEANGGPDAPVVTLLSGFGHRSPQRDRKAYDTVVQAASGIMSLTGYEGDVPLKAGISVADFLGALAGAAATIAGLLAKRRGRASPLLDVGLLQVTIWSSQPAWAVVLEEDHEPQRMGNRHWAYRVHDLFACADGDVALVCSDPESEEALMALLGLPVSDGTVAEVLAAWCKVQVAAKVVAAARSVGASAHAVESVAERVRCGALRRRGGVRTVDRPEGGRIDITGMPFRMSRSPLADRGGAPRLG